MFLERGEFVILKDGKDYADNAKDFVINMVSETRTLHKKNGCYYSHHLSKYYDFNTLEEAENAGIDFLKCRICFQLDSARQ